MSMLLDALGYLGDTLDKPGRAVRGLLGGRPEEILAAIPFSDSIGLTDKANRVSGQDFTGLDDGSLLSTIANIGTEVAMDPLMFTGLGLGAKLGRNASEAAVARGPRYATSEDDVVRMAKEFDSGGAMAQVKATDDVFGKLSSGRGGDFGNQIGPAAGGRRFNPNRLEDQFGAEARAEYDAMTEGVRRSPDEWASITEPYDAARVRNAMELEKGTIDAARRNVVADTVAAGRGVAGEAGYGAMARAHFGDMGGNQDSIRRLLSEIPPNSKMIGVGTEAMAFRTPSGQVIRLDPYAAGKPGRPIAEGVLPASATIDAGTVGRVERTPFADNVGSRDYFYPGGIGAGGPLDELDRVLAGSNLERNRAWVDDLGTHNGRPVVVNPDAVVPISQNVNTRGVPKEQAEAFLRSMDFPGPYSAVTQARDPSRLMNRLLDMLGSDDAVRRAYAMGLSGPDFVGTLGRTGAMAGANAGMLARMLSGE
ncbi:MAG TPA: hypothetical protein VMZ71_05280 [Gemmataceae bacterium]|nr:hypothetical protein [Gemmataceae bacterium]